VNHLNKLTLNRK